MRLRRRRVGVSVSVSVSGVYELGQDQRTSAMRYA